MGSPDADSKPQLHVRNDSDLPGQSMTGGLIPEHEADPDPDQPQQDFGPRGWRPR